MNLPPITNEEGRKAWSFLALTGAGMVFTLFAAFAVWILRDSQGLTFWLGLAANAQVFAVLGALGWALGRRMASKVTRDSVEFDDREQG